jgi:hypothetical protein
MLWKGGEMGAMAVGMRAPLPSLKFATSSYPDSEQTAAPRSVAMAFDAVSGGRLTVCRTV